MTKGMATSNPLNIPDARKNIKNTPSTMNIHPNIWSALSTVVLLYGDDEPGLVISYLFAVATTTTNHFFLLLGAPSDPSPLVAAAVQLSWLF